MKKLLIATLVYVAFAACEDESKDKNKSTDHSACLGDCQDDFEYDCQAMFSSGKFPINQFDALNALTCEGPLPSVQVEEFCRIRQSCELCKLDCGSNENCYLSEF